MKEALKSPLPIVIIKEWVWNAMENNGLESSSSLKVGHSEIDESFHPEGIDFVFHWACVVNSRQ